MTSTDLSPPKKQISLNELLVMYVKSSFNINNIYITYIFFTQFIIYLTHPGISQTQTRGFDRSQPLGRVLRRSRNASRWPPYARIGWRMCCGAPSVPWKWWKWSHQNINHQPSKVSKLAGGNSKIFYVHPEPWGR